ncbi:MAG: Integrase core domain protein [Parcubacteria group bacterium GW2011_GWA1_47_8]|nr:MAG: Integrase core domain protein [Parcubacteria group bacterium GW2011_GWA1_47_8]KKW07123.1 MAG: Integrase core domain protein [Parcubacteria group bacterium GW2011_GWA2_49_16]
MKKHQKRTPFVHLRERNRDRIHALYGEGHNQKSVAEILGVNPSTISRELNRYNRKTWRYNATRAEEDAQEKHTHSKSESMKVEAQAVFARVAIAGLV